MGWGCQRSFRRPKHPEGHRAAPPQQLLDEPPELFSPQLVFKLHPPRMMKDSDLGRPALSPEHLSRLGAPSPAQIGLPAGKQGEAGLGQAAKGRGAPKPRQSCAPRAAFSRPAEDTTPLGHLHT